MLNNSTESRNPLDKGLRGYFLCFIIIKRAEKGHYMKVLLYKPKKIRL